MLLVKSFTIHIMKSLKRQGNQGTLAKKLGLSGENEEGMIEELARNLKSQKGEEIQSMAKKRRGMKKFKKIDFNLGVGLLSSLILSVLAYFVFSRVFEELSTILVPEIVCVRHFSP